MKKKRRNLHEIQNEPDYIVVKEGEKFKLKFIDGTLLPLSDNTSVHEGQCFNEDDIEGYMFGGNEDQLGFIVIANFSE